MKYIIEDLEIYSFEIQIHNGNKVAEKDREEEGCVASQ